MNSQFLRRISTSCLVVLVAMPAVAVTVSAQEFRIIVNSSNATSELSVAVASKVFLKQVPKFPNGLVAQPVDQGKAAAARVAFTRAVLGRAVSAIESYWQQQIFSGKDVPPPTRGSDDDVVAFVKANAGGIGYVSPGTSLTGVKVIAVR